jgi:hypothetical protein
MLVETDGRNGYGCVMAMIDMINPIEHMVLSADLVDIEDEPHVTVLYGTHGERGPLPKNFPVPTSYRKMLYTIDTKITIFEGHKNDVIKLSVMSTPGLLEFRKYIADTFVYSHVGHTEFNPHLTLGYVKGGTGKKYIGMALPSPLRWRWWVASSSHIVYKEAGVKTTL